MNQFNKELIAKRADAKLGGGEKRIESQHKKGKLTARERLELLLDEGSFQEMGMLVQHRSKAFGLGEMQIPGDGVVTGYGTRSEERRVGKEWRSQWSAEYEKEKNE